jgi:POT family proton-dependent oligopeptide transporter
MEVKKGHPPGLYVLFFTEMWERFSYYGMRALLIFYMTETFVFGDDKAYGVYGAYTALVYLTPVFGGIVGDRILGYRKSVIIGAGLMALGHFCMAIQATSVFYLALALLIIGNGFFKANMSTIVGRLYDEGDPRRDAGYTIFYMAVNVGAAAAPILCGWVGGSLGWHWGFTLAGIGMVAGLINFLVGQYRFRHRLEPPAPTGGEGDPTPVKAGGTLHKEFAVYFVALLALGGAWWLLQNSGILRWLLIGTGGIVFSFLLVYSLVQTTGVARHRLWTALVLIAVSVVFWSFFEQAGSSLNLFADRNVDKVVLGWEVPAPVMQAINPIFIVLLGGVFAALWVKLEKVDRDPSIPMKFGLGIVQLGLGFAALYYGASISRETGMVALSWLVLGYLLHTTGELCLSPVGLSMISKLAPPSITGLMMGAWYLSISFAQYAAAGIAMLTSIDTEGAAAGEGINPVDTVMVYGGVFGQIALIAIGVGVVFMLVAPLVNRGTHGIK